MLDVRLLKNINLGPYFFKKYIFDNFKTEQLLFLKWRLIFDGPCEHLWKSNQKIIFILLIFCQINSEWTLQALFNEFFLMQGPYLYKSTEPPQIISNGSYQPR